MFPSYIDISFLDIQSWWEVPSIAYFCSLFRTAFNLLDFDIEELEEALLTDGSDHSGKSLLTELIVRLLKGSLGYNDISAFNYQMYLRRLFRKKCQDTGRYNPFNTDIDFQFLPLRSKVEILYALCDFRLDAGDVFDLFKNLEAESLRVEPLGWDDNDSAYWYFYGTRLYREDIKKTGKSKRKKSNRRRSWFYGDDYLQDHRTERVWQVVCFTEEDWTNLTEKFRKATSKAEKELFRSLSINFLPEIPRLFQEKERLQRKRLLEVAPRRTSSRVLQKIKQKDEEDKASVHDATETNHEDQDAAREVRAKRRHLLRLTRPERPWRAAEQGPSGRSRPAGPGASSTAKRRSKSNVSESDASENEKEEKEKEVKKKEMPQKPSKTTKGKEKRSRGSAKKKEPPPPPPPVRPGRKTNNSLACATGQIVIPDNDEPVNSTRRKIKTSQIHTEEDMQTDMYKVLDQLAHFDLAWPFLDPVEEEFAPNYYAVIRRPMDLHKMENRLEKGFYTDFTMFKADFKLIVNNCRLYNGRDNDYTKMVDKLQIEFDRLTEKYMDWPSSSDEEIAVEYQLPTPSRKHKIKRAETSPRPKRKKKKVETVGDLAKKKKTQRVRRKKQKKALIKKVEEIVTDKKDQEPEKEQEHIIEIKLEPLDPEELQVKGKGRQLKTPETQEPMEVDTLQPEEKKSKGSRKHKEGKGKKKRKGHRRHGKHSKINKKEHKSEKRKRGKKRGKKDAEGKREKKKKKKSKRHEAPPEPLLMEIKRSPSEESLESSNRSRSASPLPSIHTPTPSPEPVAEPPKPDPSDVLSDPEFLKDKYDKIKERRRNAAKDAWESLFEYKQKAENKQKKNIDIPHKDKNLKLKETIEKLKAKNEKISYDNLYAPGRSGLRRSKPTHTKTSKDSKDSDNDKSEKDEGVKEQEEEEEEVVVKKKKRKGSKKGKKSSAKNASASVALEQAVKDISKWLEDAPKATVVISPCDSPARTMSTEELDGSRLDDDSSQCEKSLLSRRDASRKRNSSRDNRVVKRREIQRTIERLQPGKSKGNLLTNITNKNTEKTEEPPPVGPLNKVRDTSREESSPKLSLGSVLPTVDFTLGNDHKFANKEENKVKVHKEAPKPVEIVKEVKEVQTSTEELPVVIITSPNKKDAEVETEPVIVAKPSQEKATPNLSAWFKAFGAPKSTPNTVVKKKSEEETIEKSTEATNNRSLKQISPRPGSKFDTLNEPGTPNADGDESPLTNVNQNRPRRTSTGSSVSEKSSFSQDLDSPRHQMSHTSPLLRSPASPRAEDFQKITYPIINGTVRAGFYQDTTSTKSPEKNCSPREGPHSPYSPYSQHVYALNSAAGSATPNYFIDHNKSPRPAYGQNTTYYDSTKLNHNKPRVQEHYAQDGSYHQNPFNAPYTQPIATLPPPPPPPPPVANTSPILLPPPPPPPPPVVPDPKTALFPVKKRTYNDPEITTPVKIQIDAKDSSLSPVKNDFPKPIAPLPPLSVDDIALALSEKSEMAKVNILREKNSIDYHDGDLPENLVSNDNLHDGKKELKDAEVNKATQLNKKETIDMVNMGYMNTIETHEIDYSARELSKPNHYMRKGYEVEAVAINLGISNPQLHKCMSKANINTTPNMTPAHTHETTIPRSSIHTDLGVNQHLAHVHHNQYDTLPGAQSISNFSLNDIELANKKLYSCNTAPAATAIDYGNWKVTSQIRKHDMMPSDYSTNYSTSNGEKKAEVTSSSPTAINYNKAMHNQQYASYNNLPRSTVPRTQEMQQSLPSELRIPNPRGLMKADSVVATSTITDSDVISKSMEAHTKSQKPEKQPMVSIPYKTTYTTLSSLPIDTLRNLPNYPRMLERYREDERYLSSYSGGAALFHDKAYQMAELFNKTIASEAHQSSTPMGYAQSTVPISKDNTIYKTSSSSASHADAKPKIKRKRTTEPKTPVSSQNYNISSCNSDILTSVKQGMIPTSAFNMGTGMNMAALGGMYPDNGGYALVDDFRNSTNQLMAANYMAAAVAHQRSNDVAAEKLVKPAHQNSSHTGSFSFIGPQVRAGYPFVGADPSSPLYQQYLQRYQEELQRQTGAQIMGLYAPPYATQLAARQPYDSINRPTWL